MTGTNNFKGTYFLGIFRLVVALWVTFYFISQSTAVEPSGLHKIRLISEKEALSPFDDSALVAIDIQLAPHWKTYWRSPGQYGIPLKLAVVESLNVAKIKTLWPAPTRYVDSTFPSLSTIGYKDRLVLPLQLLLDEKNEGAMVVLDVSFGVCFDMCIPINERMAITLPIGEPESTKDSNLFVKWLARIPSKDVSDRFRIAAVSDPERIDKLLIATCYSGSDAKIDVFLEDSHKTSFATPLTFVSQSQNFRLYRATADANLISKSAGIAPIAGTPITMTFVSEDHIYERNDFVSQFLPNSKDFCPDSTQ